MEFMNKNFPAGLRTELLGNCILPYFGKSQGMSAYHHHLDDWMTLKLPYVYGRIGKQFSRYIPNDLLSLFWVQQGLIEYQNRYCKPALCDACSLR